MNTNETPKSHAEKQALAQYRSICLLLDAIDFDYASYAEMDDIDNADDAADRLREDALEVQVRTDWHDYGSTDTETPTEFYILLCTGGPAVRIIGELDEHGKPSRAWLEYQDWGTPWTHLYIEGSNDVLCRYASYYLGY
jgi:hypothetical protein